MKLRIALLSSLLLLGLNGCQQSDTGRALPQTLLTEPSQEDVQKLELFATLAEQYLHSGTYRIEYSDLPATIYGWAWQNQAQINTLLVGDDWELARTTVHELCHTGQYNQGRWGFFDRSSAYEERWHEIECKSIELDGATYIYTALGLPLPTAPHDWEDYYFHTKLLTEFYGKDYIRYYPETYITTWADKAARPKTFIQE
jgi:hypothetical protein